MKNFIVFTPVNPTRPFYERLQTLHHYNVKQNTAAGTYGYKYVEKKVCLAGSLQNNAMARGQNVIREFNKAYSAHKTEFRYICKWDDDMILPANILNMCRFMFEDDPKIIGMGLYQEEYGAPNILMADPVKDGFYGAFSRFYCYRMNVWNEIGIVEGHGDPDNAYQIGLKGKKEILDVPSIHLDHRHFTERQYKVLLDLAAFSLMK